MSMWELALWVYLGFSLLWCGAVTVKAAWALRTTRSYRFAFWDGGLWLSGRDLSRRWTAGLLVAAALFAIMVAARIAWRLAGAWTLTLS